MKITQARLLQIIKEEISNIHEAEESPPAPAVPMSAGARLAAKADAAQSMGTFSALAGKLNTADAVAAHIINAVKGTDLGKDKDLGKILRALDLAKLQAKTAFKK